MTATLHSIRQPADRQPAERLAWDNNPHPFGGTEADSQISRWPRDIIAPDDRYIDPIVSRDEMEMLTRELIVADDVFRRRLVCDAPNTALRYSRRSYGVDSRYPGSARTPIEPMAEPSKVDEWIGWICFIGALVVIGLLLAGYGPRP